MAITEKWFGNAILNAFGGTSGSNPVVSWVSHNIMVALVTAVPNQDTAQYWSDVSGTEITGATAVGYTPNGQLLTGKSVSYNSSTKTISFIAANPDWGPTATITAAAAVVYDATPATAGTQPVLAFIDFGGNKSSTAADFQIAWSTSGVMSITIGT